MPFQLMFSLLYGMGKIVGDDVHASRLNACPISPLPAFCFLPVDLGEQVVYYSRASVVILSYIVLQNYYCVLIFVLSLIADSG